MCGIAGFLGRAPRLEMEAQLEAMAGSLRHRGPDDAGVWADPEAGAGLAHRRLSILDLSAEGHQPMRSADGRYVIVYNGEIYNFADLRAELPAQRFRGHSDTEVLLAAVSAWGLEATLSRLNGMFAFALWDERERLLRLARDRLGEKPLYYGWVGSTFLFGSELKALRAHPAFSAEIDRDALALYFRYANVPAPYSIYRGIHKLPPATWLAVGHHRRDATPVAYWSAAAAAERGVAAPLGRGEAEEAMDALLRDAVKIRMVADVPLGAFLSGGIDSSAIVALMQAQSRRPVRTFSIGFAEAGFDEAEDAAAVARRLGTDHTARTVTPADCLSVIPRLPALWDEPFADASQVPTYLVAELARPHVKVALSGDGGDELFGGYHRHFWRLWERFGWVPGPFRRASGRLLSAAAEHLPRTARRKLGKLAGVVSAPSVEAMYGRLLSHWQAPPVLGATEPPSAATDARRWAALAVPTQRIMLLDLVSYLPDDILVKLDRATMGVSLEGRVPYLDHRAVELSWRIPPRDNLGHPRGKGVLRRILARYLPPSYFEGKPKRGFVMPLLAWLRGPLRDWAESLLDPRRLAAEGWLDAPAVRRAWEACVAGAAEGHQALWDVLMFQAWLGASVGAGGATLERGAAERLGAPRRRERPEQV